MKLVNYVKTW